MSTDGWLKKIQTFIKTTHYDTQTTLPTTPRTKTTYKNYLLTNDIITGHFLGGGFGGGSVDSKILLRKKIIVQMNNTTYQEFQNWENEFLKIIAKMRTDLFKYAEKNGAKINRNNIVISDAGDVVGVDKNTSIHILLRLKTLGNIYKYANRMADLAGELAEEIDKAYSYGYAAAKRKVESNKHSYRKRYRGIDYLRDYGRADEMVQHILQDNSPKHISEVVAAYGITKNIAVSARMAKEIIRRKTIARANQNEILKTTNNNT